MEKQYEMRKLIFSDVFKMSKILKKLNLKDKIAGIVREIKVDENDDVNVVGKELAGRIVYAIMEDLDPAQDEVNDFMGSLVGIKGKEFNELDLDIALDIFTQFKEQKGLVSFFKSATK